jgi:malonyl-CoA/methylmalonyl-CoA synthetase
MATAVAHDQEAYFRTGDIGHREGQYYFIDGRASLDIIKSGGYKISALDVERELMGLPYIAEAMVVGVDDEEFGQRVGAVVTLRDYQSSYSTRPEGRKLLLDSLRQDLTSKLIGYKLPALLRVVDGELPKSQTGKVLKRVLGPELFPPHRWHECPEIQVWGNRKLDLKSKL